MRRLQVVFLTLIALSCCLGCGPKKPAGIPALCSASITVVHGDAPVANANVFFLPTTDSLSGSWSNVGLTDAKGVAKMETRQGEWKASGVPEGEYKVYFTKVVQIEEPEQPADMDSNEEAKAEYYKERQARLEAAANEIPKALTNYETSGITVTVSKSSGLNTTIDVAQYE